MLIHTTGLDKQHQQQAQGQAHCVAMNRRAGVSYARACELVAGLAKSDLKAFERLQSWVCETFVWAKEAPAAAPAMVVNINLQHGRVYLLCEALAAAGANGLQLLLGNAVATGQQQQQQDALSRRNCLQSNLLRHAAAAQCAAVCIRACTELFVSSIESCSGTAATRRARVQAAATLSSAGMEMHSVQDCRVLSAAQAWC
jgi:hypothetical protein